VVEEPNVDYPFLDQLFSSLIRPPFFGFAIQGCTLHFPITASASPNQIVKPTRLLAAALSTRPRGAASNPALPVQLTIFLDSSDAYLFEGQAFPGRSAFHEPSQRSDQNDRNAIGKLLRFFAGLVPRSFQKGHYLFFPVHC
jgi:hypothetical protein